MDVQNSNEMPFSENARWLKYIDEEFVVVETTDMEKKILDAIRRVLLSDDVEASAKQTALQIRTCYEEACHEDGLLQSLFSMICNFIFEVASRISFTDAIRHGKLVAFLTILKLDAADEYDLDTPQIGYDSEILLLRANDMWNHNGVNEKHNADLPDVRLKYECDRWVNTSAFLARLLDAGMLGECGLHWAGTDITEGLKREGAQLDNLIQKCHVAVATQYLLLAGSTIFHEVKFPSSQWVNPMDMNAWESWTAKLKEIARANHVAEWNLTLDAQRAYTEMNELYLESSIYNSVVMRR